MNVVNILWSRYCLFVDINLNISQFPIAIMIVSVMMIIFTMEVHSILHANYVTFDSITNKEQIIIFTILVMFALQDH